MTEPQSEAKAEKLSYAATGRQRNVTRFNEKMAFFRRWSRASSSKWHLFEEGRALQREDGFCSQTIAPDIEKTAFSRRWSRASSSKWLLFEEGRVLQREDGFCSQ